MTQLTEYEILVDLYERKALASSSKMKVALVDEAAALLGCSRQTVYRKGDDLGLSKPRKRRHDAGSSVMSDEETRLLAGVLRASSTERGQRLPVRDGLDILIANGKLKTPVHESTASRQLYLRNMHPEQMALPTPCVQMAAEHENHVAQVDSTTGIYYYMPGGRLRFMAEDEHYKNKLHKLAKAATDLVTRYSYVDVASHAGKARHFLGGETIENLLEFLTWSMWRQGRNPVHGVPRILMMDPGAANKSHVMFNFCKNLGVQLIHHAPGAARVTGSVEKFHDLIGMHFERRLRFQNPGEVNLQKLDEWLDEWLVAYCTTRIHTRHKRTRFEQWMRIAPEHLRVPASLEVLREAAVSKPETRRVENNRTVSFKARTYALDDVPGVIAGLKVTLQTNVFRDPMIDVQFIDQTTGEETWHTVAPVVVNDLGYREDSPVWGRDMKRAAFSELDHNRTALLRDAYANAPTLEDAAKARKQHAQAFSGEIDAMADVRATPVPTYMPRRSTPLDAATHTVVAVRLTTPEACKRLKAELGEAYGPHVYAWVAAKFTDGVPEDQITSICAQFTETEQLQATGTDTAAPPGLRIVGGAL